MSEEIEVDEKAVEIVSKYTRKSPAETPLIFERIVKEWYLRAASAWSKNKNLIPKLKKVPESRRTKVGIDSRVAKNYKTILRKFGLDEAELTSWLSWIFINAFKLKEKGEAKHIKKW